MVSRPSSFVCFHPSATAYSNCLKSVLPSPIRLFQWTSGSPGALSGTYASITKIIFPVMINIYHEIFLFWSAAIMRSSCSGQQCLLTTTLHRNNPKIGKTSNGSNRATPKFMPATQKPRVKWPKEVCVQTLWFPPAATNGYLCASHGWERSRKQPVSGQMYHLRPHPR